MTWLRTVARKRVSLRPIEHASVVSIRIVGQLGLLVGGMLWVGVAVSAAVSGAVSGGVMVGAVTLVAVSLLAALGKPTGSVGWSKWFLTGVGLVLMGLALILLFGLGAVWILADWLELQIGERALVYGREIAQIVVSAGLIVLAVSLPAGGGLRLLRIVMLAVGVAGICLSVVVIPYEGLVVWHLGIGVAWVLLAVACWPERSVPAAGT